MRKIPGSGTTGRKWGLQGCGRGVLEPAGDRKWGLGVIGGQEWGILGGSWGCLKAELGFCGDKNGGFGVLGGDLGAGMGNLGF